MRKLQSGLALAAMLLVAQRPVSAQVQFYNGDFDGTDSLPNEINTSTSQAMVYENFTIGGGGLFVDGIFGQMFSTFTWTTGQWEVRSGVSDGNGGALLFSGTDLFTSQVFVGTALDLDIFEGGVEFSGFFLAPGEYWFGLAPVGTGGESERAWLTTSSGANGVNANLDGNYFWNSSYFGSNFREDSHGDLDFSLGVEGRLSESTVPEPATMTLLATGLAGMAAARRRKRTNG